MVRHIVFWNFHDGANGLSKPEIMARVKRELEALVGVVPGLLKAEVGVGFNPNGFDCCLYSEFESAQALDGYQEHPAHVAVKGFVHQVVAARAVCDYEL